MHTALAARERFPIVIADPPYLPTDEVAHWPSDPVHAIDGGADGLDLLRVSLRVSAQHLLPDGHLLLQVAGAAQAERVCADVPPGLTVHGTRDVDARRAVLHLTRDPR
jgi:release factor glutamine methyltransferase